ncbi:hypothetical protein DL93DRAFT_2057785 [Clavulina sp. PMI_390]|nr:hypothetical protein DL93DRAFT_2057785 [Clavulina sp. PMI_390]
MLTLQHFLLRPKALALYREAIRATRGIPDVATRRETIAWIRSEFERNRGEQDIERIRTLIRSGRRDLASFLPAIRHSNPLR